MQDIDADYQVLDLGLMVILDKNIKKVGIWIPETPLGKKIVSSAVMSTYRSKTLLDQSKWLFSIYWVLLFEPFERDQNYLDWSKLIWNFISQAEIVITKVQI